jgi:autotransporter translocation and assembly factor TamB
MKNRVVLLSALLALSSFVALAADVSGKWTGEAMGKGRQQTFTLKQDGSALTGTVQGGRGPAAEIMNGKVDGDNVSFEVTREFNGNSMTIKYSGSVSGNSMKLSVNTGRGQRELALTKQ